MPNNSYSLRPDAPRPQASGPVPWYVSPSGPSGVSGGPAGGTFNGPQGGEFDPRYRQARPVGEPTDPGAQGWAQAQHATWNLEDLMQFALNQSMGNQGPSQADQALAQQAFDATAQGAASSFKSQAGDLARIISGQFAERGLSGSSFEAAQAGMGQVRLQEQLGQILNQARGEQANALMNAPLKRAQANAMLFDSITKAAQPVLDWRRQQLGIGSDFKKKSNAEAALGAVGAAAELGSKFIK